MSQQPQTTLNDCWQWLAKQLIRVSQWRREIYISKWEVLNHFKGHFLSWLGHVVHNYTHLVGETTSKQNLLSLSSQGLTEHSLRSSTTTVKESWEEERHNHYFGDKWGTKIHHKAHAIERDLSQNPIVPSVSFGRPAGCSGWKTIALQRREGAWS